MQKISRIYVGNYGIKLAWYDGQLFDLRDPESGEATDTIINLENGGGKTTLLSFILSCFEPQQNKWLKHLGDIQGRNHFHEYFSDDGLPATCVIEWQMPPRSAKGEPYLLVMGQVVSVHAAADRPNIDRLFFAFEANEGLSLESLPVPKISGAPAMTFGEVRRWLREAQEANTDVQFFEGLEAWQRHLRDERLIDLEMLRMQVMFSALEGGFDKGFLGFKTEEEFLRKLLGLTLNEERAAAMREAVVRACEKLRRKPQYERRLSELKKLADVVSTFVEKAEALAEVQTAQATYATTAGQLAVALRSRESEERTRAEKHKAEGSTQDRIQTDCRNRHQTAVSNHQGLELLRFQLDARFKQRAKNAAESAFDTAKLEIKYIQAAQSLAKLLSLKEQDEELTARADEAEQGLKPQRAQVVRAGSLLRYALLQEERSARTQAKLEGDKEAAAKESAKRHGEALNALEREDRKLASEEAKLSEAQRAYTEGQKRLIQEGVLLADSPETALQAVDRILKVIAALRDEQAQLKRERSEFRAQETTCLEKQTAAKVEAQRLDGLAAERNKYLAKGFAARERLAQDAVLHLALEADIADPDSPAVLAALERLIQATDKELEGLTIRIAELDSQQQAIQDTGLSERNPDVGRVIERLAELGLKSARAFNGYLAEVESDAERAGQLVISNPARFLGVAVASGEIAKAREILADAPSLARPVMVSEATRDADTLEPSAFVVPAGDHSAYNFTDAEALGQRIAKLIAGEQARHSQFQERRKNALSTEARLNAYLEEYGASRMAQAKADLDKFHGEAEKSRQLAEDAKQQAQQLHGLAEAREKEISLKTEAIGRAQDNERRLRQFHDEHEAAALTRQARLTVLATEQKELREKKEIARAAQAEQREQETGALGRRMAFETSAKQASSEWAAILYYDNSLPAADELRNKPQLLGTLRELYQTAKEIFEANEKDQLGLLRAQLQQVRTSRAAAQTAYDKDFSGVPGGEAKKRLELNFESALAQAELARTKAESVRDTRRGEHAFAQRDMDGYAAKNPDATRYDLEDVAPTEASEAEVLASLPGRINEAISEVTRLAEGEKTAGELAKQARTAAGRSEALARDAIRARETLASALSPVESTGGSPTALQEDFFKQVQVLISEHKESKAKLDKALNKARDAFEKLKAAVAAPSFVEAEPELSRNLQRNDFEAGCSDRQRLANGLADRIKTTEDNLSAMQADFEGVVGEVYTLASDGTSILNSAISKKNRVPEGAPYVGGKPVLRMSRPLLTVSVDTRKDALRNYLGTLIDTGQVPQKGSDLVAVAILRMQGRSLGLQILRMVKDEAHQYVPVGEISNSGGEGVTMAMFLYILINKLRAEQQAHVHKVGGGPLILDNPFAKATSVPLLRVQRQFARAAGLQLIFATALADYNSLGEFQRFIRLRHAGRNSKTGRNHIEMVDFQLTEPNEVVNG